MSETTTREKIKVMEAFEADEKIQYRDAATDRPWRDWNAPAPMWNWAHLDYRIKPKQTPPMEMKTCPACGGLCDDWMLFCPHCGHFYGTDDSDTKIYGRSGHNTHGLLFRMGR